MNRKTIDTYLVTFDKFDHDFNLIGQGVVQGFETQKESFDYAMQLNLTSITMESKTIFKVEFKTYRKTLKNQILASASNDRLKIIFN